MSFNYADMIRTTAFRNGQAAYRNFNDNNPYKDEYEQSCWKAGYNYELTMEKAAQEFDDDDYNPALEDD